MRPATILACLAMLLIVNCKKQGSAGPVSFNGTWELYKVSGQATVNYSPGNGNDLKFLGDNYQMFTNGSLTKSGKFFVADDTTATTSTCLIFPAGQFNRRIIYDSNYNAPKVFIELSNNTLTLVSGCFAYDGGSFSYYARK